jgi:cytochrome c oxidase subunit 4
MLERMKHLGAFTVGWIVGAILTVLTIVEYFIAIHMEGNFLPLTAFALAKVVLIVYFFMHINRLWRPEAH